MPHCIQNLFIVGYQHQNDAGTLSHESRHLLQKFCIRSLKQACDLTYLYLLIPCLFSLLSLLWGLLCVAANMLAPSVSYTIADSHSDL